jgi:hypothetical protein
MKVTSQMPFAGGQGGGALHEECAVVVITCKANQGAPVQRRHDLQGIFALPLAEGAACNRRIGRHPDIETIALSDEKSHVLPGRT